MLIRCAGLLLIWDAGSVLDRIWLSFWSIPQPYSYPFLECDAKFACRKCLGFVRMSVLGVSWYSELCYQYHNHVGERECDTFLITELFYLYPYNCGSVSTFFLPVLLEKRSLWFGRRLKSPLWILRSLWSFSPKLQWKRRKSPSRTLSPGLRPNRWACNN